MRSTNHFNLRSSFLDALAKTNTFTWNSASTTLECTHNMCLSSACRLCLALILNSSSPCLYLVCWYDYGFFVTFHLIACSGNDFFYFLLSFFSLRYFRWWYFFLWTAWCETREVFYHFLLVMKLTSLKVSVFFHLKKVFQSLIFITRQCKPKWNEL